MKAIHEPDDHDGKIAVRETVASLLERFEPEEPPTGRAQVGFIEVAREKRDEDWSSFQMFPRESRVEHGPRPILLPLIDLINRGRGRPVLAVSAERVHGWVWERGQLQAEPSWEAELAIYPGRERKAPAMADPARGQATSSSGHDQFGQRLEENRKRFLEDFAHHLQGNELVRGAEVVVIGEPPYLEEFVAGMDPSLDVWKIEGPDVINEPESTIIERVSREIEQALDEQQAELVETIIEAAMSGGRGAAGANETSEALLEGRVEQLALGFDHVISHEDLSPLALEGVEGAGELDGSELLIELALRSSADVTSVTGSASDALHQHGGVAALLRY